MKIQSKLQVWLMGMFICMGSFVLGYNSVCLSALQSLIRNKNNLQQYDLDWVLSLSTSALNLGALLGIVQLCYYYLGLFLYKPIVNYFGQLQSMRIIDILCIIALVFQIIQLKFIYLFLGRLILGILIGISICIIPVYLNSIAPKSLSGFVGSINQLMIVVGIVVAQLMTFIITDDKKDELFWRIMLFLPIIACCLRIISLSYIYPFDTIQRHIGNNQILTLQHYCQIVYKNYTVQQLIEQKTGQKKKQTNKNYNNSNKQNSYSKINDHNSRQKNKRILIAIIIIASNQLSGINAIFYYSRQIFNKIMQVQINTNNNNNFQKLLILLLALIQVFANLISANFIDKYGRKKLLLCGQITLIGILCGIFISEEIQYSIFYRHVSMVGLIFIHVFVFNLTLGPICIIYSTELVEDVTPIILTLKLCSFIFAIGTQFTIQILGIGKMFASCAFMTFVAYLYLKANTKQTKGMTKNQIYSLYESQSNNTTILLTEDQQDKLSQ